MWARKNLSVSCRHSTSHALAAVRPAENLSPNRLYNLCVSADTVSNIVMLYETTGSLSPRKPVKSSSFSHRYAFSKKEISHAPSSAAAVLCENAEVFELWTRAALATWRQRKFGSQPAAAQNKIFLPTSRFYIVGLLQLKTNNNERRLALAVRCYISHLFEQLRAFCEICNLTWRGSLAGFLSFIKKACTVCLFVCFIFTPIVPRRSLHISFY